MRFCLDTLTTFFNHFASRKVLSVPRSIQLPSTFVRRNPARSCGRQNTALPRARDNFETQALRRQWQRRSAFDYWYRRARSATSCCPVSACGDAPSQASPAVQYSPCLVARHAPTAAWCVCTSRPSSFPVFPTWRADAFCSSSRTRST